MVNASGGGDGNDNGIRLPTSYSESKGYRKESNRIKTKNIRKWNGIIKTEGIFIFMHVRLERKTATAALLKTTAEYANDK